SDSRRAVRRSAPAAHGKRDGAHRRTPRFIRPACAVWDNEEVSASLWLEKSARFAAGGAASPVGPWLIFFMCLMRAPPIHRRCATAFAQATPVARRLIQKRKSPSL